MSTKATAEQDGGGARKFLFDRSFHDEPSVTAAARAPVKTVFTAKEAEDIRAEARKEGYNAGQKAMMENQQQLLNVLLSQIDQQLGSLCAESEDQWRRQLAYAQETALAAVRKLVPAYAERHGLEEIEAVVTQVLAEMAHEPRLVVRVGDARFEDVKAALGRIAEQKAYVGKVVVLCETDLGPADCRVEWADGGIERDWNALWGTIDRIINSGVGDRGSGIGNSPNSDPRSPVPDPGIVETGEKHDR